MSIFGNDWARLKAGTRWDPLLFSLLAFPM
jgi:hypothetical protein